MKFKTVVEWQQDNNGASYVDLAIRIGIRPEGTPKDDSVRSIISNRMKAGWMVGATSKGEFMVPPGLIDSVQGFVKDHPDAEVDCGRYHVALKDAHGMLAANIPRGL